MTVSPQRKLNLLQIALDLDVGGLQEVIYQLCRGIDRTRFNVAAIALRSSGVVGDKLQKLGIPVYRIRSDRKSDQYLSFLKLRRIIRKRHVDIIHSHNTDAWLDGVLAKLSCPGRIRYIHTDHARRFPDKRRRMVLEFAAACFTDRVVGVSEHTSRSLHRYEKIPLRKLTTIPNGIDGAPFAKPVDRAEKLRQLGIADEFPILGVAVRLTEQKGLTYLIRAMPTVLRSFPRARLLIAGEGPLAEHLIALTQEMALDRHVLFLGKRTDVPELLRLFDLFVLPSIWEGLPMVILECFAAGCPVVATDVGGNATAIRDGFNGRLVRSQDIASLSEAILEVLGSERLRARFVQRAYDTFEKHFTIGNMVENYERLYLLE